MAMISGKNLKVGIVIHYNGGLYRVMKTQIIAPGNWRAFVQTKMRNIQTGTQTENRFRTDETIERAEFDRREVEYLYQDGGIYYFMECDTYEQFPVSAEILGDAIEWLQPNLKMIVEKNDGTPIGVELPTSIKLKVVETEPYIKTATATNSFKNAKLENGVTLGVPGFITEGELIEVDPTAGEYIGRAK